MKNKEDLQWLYNQKHQYEQALNDQGYKLIVGIDEVGRGPLAGPVTVGAVILDPNKPILGLKDSKRLSSKKIEQLSKKIKEDSLDWAVYSVGAAKIDEIGIKNAVHYAMRKAVAKLNLKPDYGLIDYEYVKFRNFPTKAIVKGDDLSNSIAAASIIAKYTRDRKMQKLAKVYPQYKFEKNVGYGTKDHLSALAKLGPISDVHRFSFKPIRKD